MAIKTLSLHDLDALRRSDAQWALFDIRETAEADSGHIFGATFLPRRMIEPRIADLVSDLSTPLIVYGDGEYGRAELAADTLGRLGYRDARVLEGGLRAWTASGRLVVSGSNVPSKLFGERVHEGRHVPRLSAAALHDWQRNGKEHVVCDIRTPDEYAAGRIPQAYGAFGVDLALVAADLKARHCPVVVHCAGRTRSIIACQTLRELGVQDAYALENGTMGWQLAGFELERGAGRGVLEPSPQSLAAARDSVAARAAEAGVQLIDNEQLLQWLDERAQRRRNLYVFDVRQVEEYAAGHIEGAAALPGGLAIQRTDEFAAIKHAPIVFTDDGGARASLTAFWFRQMGWSQVYVLRGGIPMWRQGGHPIATGRARSAPSGWKQARANAPAVSADALAARRPRPLIVDVDTSRYHEAARVPGAVWIPYGWLESRIAAHAPSLDMPIVVTCHNGLHSTYAAANLRRIGYTDVHVLEGGVDAWRKHHPVDEGWPQDLPRERDLVVQPYHSSLAEMARYLDWEQRLTASIAKALEHDSA